MRRTVEICLVMLLVAGCAKEDETTDAPAVETTAPALTAEQQAVATQARAASDKYKDVQVALAEGYMKDPTNTCMDAIMVGLTADAGSMGVHYFRPDLLGVNSPPDQRVDGADAIIDVNAPEILVYEPQMDGGMQLVAAEYLVFQQPWTAAGNAAPPVLAGQTFVSMADDPATPTDEAHGFTPHYELHVWAHRDNPAGLFAEFNPTVTCAHAPMGQM